MLTQNIEYSSKKNEAFNLQILIIISNIKHISAINICEIVWSKHDYLRKNKNIDREKEDQNYEY